MATSNKPALRRLLTASFYVGSIALVAIWLIPFVLAVFTSFKTMDDFTLAPAMWTPPSVWTWENFPNVFVQARMGTYMLNTLIITTLSVAGTLFVGTLSGFALAFYKFRGRQAVLLLFIAGMLLPFQMILLCCSIVF